jgi:hypothetical protein
MRATTDPTKFQAACERYCEMMADGQGSKAALDATGLSHAQADIAWYESPLNPAQVVRGSVTIPEVPGKDEPGYEVAINRIGLIVAELRNGTHEAYPEQKLSWGQIGIVTNTTESTVRRYFRTSGISDKGMRKGRGGRFLAGDPRGYLGNHKSHGIQAANPHAAVTKEYVAKADDWTPELPKAVDGLRKKLGGTTAKKATRARKSTKATA